MQLKRNVRRVKNAKVLLKDSLEGRRHQTTTYTVKEPATIIKNIQIIAKNVV